MSPSISGVTPPGVLLAVAIAILFAELAGYALHRLMHSGLFPGISRSHMIHHLQLYGPDQAMRSPEYKDATEGRASLGNIGMEWLLPSAAILALCWIVMWGTGVGWRYQALVLSTLLGWPIFMFSYLHDRMHLENFWMARTPLIELWFKQARRLHDVHHRSLNDDGFMNRNFGIGFFFFDRLFGTFAKRHRPLNRIGFRAVMRRHRLDAARETTGPGFPSDYRV